MDELTTFASMRPDTEALSADERADLRVNLFGSAADGSGADPAVGAPPSIADDPESTLIELQPAVWQPGRRARRRRRARYVVAVATAAAIIAAIVVVISRDATAPADIPIPVPSPLEEPSPDEVALASDANTYVVGGHTEVTPARNYVSLRCRPQQIPGCVGAEEWAYVTGGADNLEVHYGLLGVADYLTVSALDDRLFVASGSPSTSPDPQSAPAWLIDSVTGQRGALSWREQPVTLNSPDQALVPFPAHPNPYYFEDEDSIERFLPRVVDRRDWTIRPLRVPEDATAALSIAQPGSDRIWIGTAHDGRLGLAYTYDGGASWTDVELPQRLDDSGELTADPQGHYPLLVAASGDHVAVTKAATGFDDPHEVLVFVSANAGDNWTTVPIVSEGHDETELFVLADHRLTVVLGQDDYSQSVLVSNSASDWSQVEDSNYEPTASYSHLDVNQHGVVVHFDGGANPPARFSIDLSDWWTIPGLPLSPE